MTAPWNRPPPRWADTGMGLLFLIVGSLGLLGGIAFAVAGVVTQVWAAVILALPWIGFFGIGVLTGVRWFQRRYAEPQSN